MKEVFEQMSRALLCAVFCLVSGIAFAAPKVSDVQATKKTWGYTITYRVSGMSDEDEKAWRLEISTTVNGVRKYARSLVGDAGSENGTHRVNWMAQQDGLALSDASGTVSVRFRKVIHRYCVIDLSGGPSVKAFPVAYLEREPKGGFGTTEYKTSKLVLKRVEAGSFIMGDRQLDDSYRVKISEPFYMGIYEVTQRQFELVMGVNPSSFAGEDANPVENVSYDMIRGEGSGSEWPASDDVDRLSFLGRLRAKTKVDFDLPTEAQWEYTCRAGTTTAFSCGVAANSVYMWFKPNAEGRPHAVGTKRPNPWGFYDMHGNVAEWCRDWRGDLSFGTDPRGPLSGAERVARGGGWGGNAAACSLAESQGGPSSSAENGTGFRLFMPLRSERREEAKASEGNAPRRATVRRSSLGAKSAKAYCVIDLSGGDKARRYPVTYLADEPEGGFNTTEYKTTKLVLKRVAPGRFVMGQEQMDDRHVVTLTKPFYMGIFEVTDKQWELVMGWRLPSTTPSHPVASVSYNMIRGAGVGSRWPESNEVDGLSFLGKLRVRTGLDFDLPTEAQWEYTCRAGTTTTYSYGSSANGTYMWYRSNSNPRKRRDVAPREERSNPWGFYDMHGNVWEWCVDKDWNGKLSYGKDPKGPSSGTHRVLRGGGWYSTAPECTSFWRRNVPPSERIFDFGFRLCLPTK